MLAAWVISWCLSLGCCLGSDVTLWGVHPTEVRFYDPKNDFRCKDGSMTVAFSRVNDDYCDCPDATDEPSTSACVNGVFYCSNEGHVGLTVPSSRVNDGTCDCCDGSDEYASGSCVNDCADLAEAARAEEEEKLLRFAADDEEEFRANLVHTGSRKQIEKLEKFKKLELAKAEQEEWTKELEEKTRLAEEIANAALDSYRGEIKEEKSEDSARSSYEEQRMAEAFSALDLDGNGVLDMFEIKAERIFDLNKNNRVEDREIKWYFDAMPGIANLEVFGKKMWRKMGRLYVLEKEMEKSFSIEFDWDKKGEDESSRKEAERKQKEHQEQMRKEAASIKEEQARMERDAGGIEEDDVNFDEHAGEYDDKTREALLEAIKARDELSKAKEKLKDLTKQKEWAEKTLYEPEAEESDPDEPVTEHLDEFGPQERDKYFPGRMHCFKLTGNEFQYKLCPFWGASQTPRHRQNAGIDLGRWVGWGKEKGEPIMVFKGGEPCDGGVRRSTKVRVFCGSRSMLVHVEEPRPCEYRMDFKSPAGCHIKHLKEANVTITSHDEL